MPKSRPDNYERLAVIAGFVAIIILALGVILGATIQRGIDKQIAALRPTTQEVSK